MPTQDDIEQQQRLLATYRHTLAHLLQQAAQYGGEPFAPTQTANGIAEARANIEHIKKTLHDWGIPVYENPGDKGVLPTLLNRTHQQVSEKRYRQKTRQFVILVSFIIMTLLTILFINTRFAASVFKNPSFDVQASSPPSSMPTISDIRPEPYIADWSGAKSYDKLFLFLESCKDNEHPSNPLGKKPAYFVFYKARVALTLVNPDTGSNGIIRIEPVYNTDFEKQNRLGVWYITMYESDDDSQVVELPVELPPRVPKKWFFRAVHVVETQPSVSSVTLLNYGNTLSPLRIILTVVNHKQVTYNVDLFPVAPEAIPDGRFKYSKECKELLPEWPQIPIPGRQIQHD